MERRRNKNNVKKSKNMIFWPVQDHSGVTRNDSLRDQLVNHHFTYTEVPGIRQSQLTTIRGYDVICINHV